MAWPIPPPFQERIIPGSSTRVTEADEQRAEQQTRALRHERFAREYVIDLNRARAAIAAGYHPDQADHFGALLLNRQEVKRLVRRLMAEKASRLEIKADRVVEELARLGFSNVLDYMQPDEFGSMRLDFSKVTRDQAAAIAEIREDNTGGTGDGQRKQIVRTTLKLADKLRALELIGKYLGLYQERMKIDVEVTFSDKLEQARKRVLQFEEVKKLPARIA